MMTNKKYLKENRKTVGKMSGDQNRIKYEQQFIQLGKLIKEGKEEEADNLRYEMDVTWDNISEKDIEVLKRNIKMACETCDHTMQKVNEGTPKVFWCPQCGTIKSEGSVPEFEEPTIVKRAFKLCEQLEVSATDRRWGKSPYVVALKECF